jgi:two-component system, OmpR family, response regulator MprA
VGTRILLAEDDRSVREALARALQLEGHDVDVASDGQAALAAMAAAKPDLVIVDWMMPVRDGLSVCQQMRAAGDRTPVLILTARSDVRDRVAGLDAGADDYLPKPFSLDELLARVRALLRRNPTEGSDRELRVADLVVAPAARQARRGDRVLDLTKTEYDLLEVLVRHAGIVCTHSMIYDLVWGYDFGPDSKTLAVYVSYLRRKLEQGGEPRLLQTVRGVGYVMRAP